MRIAIIRLSSLGDVVHTAASLQMIHRNVPNSKISMVVDKRFADVLDHNPDIENVIKIDLKGLLKQKPFLASVRSEYRRLSAFGPFDIVIDLHGMIKSAIIATILGGKKIGRRISRESLAKLFYNQLIESPPIDSSVDRVAAMITGCIGCTFQPVDLGFPEPYLFWTEEDADITREFFSESDRNILFVPGSSTPHKDYPSEHFVQLSNILKENVMICHGGTKELEAATRIAEKSPYARVLPRLTLNQLKAAIGRSDLVVGGDTGPVHIASACGVPSITLFGTAKVCITQTESNRAIVAPSAKMAHNSTLAQDCMSRIAPTDVARVAREILDIMS